MRTNQFSESLGLSEPQVETLTQVSDELKTAIWNIIYVLTHSEPVFGSSYSKIVYPDIVEAVADFFKITRDEVANISSNQFWQRFKPLFFKLNGVCIYDFIHFVAKNIASEKNQQEFMTWLNEVLQEKTSPCRFIAGQLTPITGKENIASLNQATSTASPKINDDIKDALACLYKQQPIKACNHAAKALETLLKNMFHTHKGTAGSLAPELKQFGIHPIISGCIDKIWGYCSDTTRHGQPDSFLHHPDMADATLVVLSCANLINYLNEKQAASP